MSDYHEPYELLDPETRDTHRALVSLREEVEAIDWYSQRIAVCADADLKHVLTHARDEEIEHACLALEWLRKHHPKWDFELRKRLFNEGVDRSDIDERGAQPQGGGLGVGQTRKGG
ncbi:MAG TPA: ferritin [Polyangiaceae bacterium]|jgi:ferritin-like protein|nr:ferritin [Polyangiaceae bacterium]